MKDSEHLIIHIYTAVIAISSFKNLFQWSVTYSKLQPYYLSDIKPEILNNEETLHIFAPNLFWH